MNRSNSQGFNLKCYKISRRTRETNQRYLQVNILNFIIDGIIDDAHEFNPCLNFNMTRFLFNGKRIVIMKDSPNG